MRIVAAFIALLTGCGGAEPFEAVPDAEAAKAVAGRVCSLFAKAELMCDWQGNTAKIEGHEVKVDAILENEIVLGSSATLELRYDFTVPSCSRSRGRCRSEVPGPRRAHR